MINQQHPIKPSFELLQDWGGRFYDQQLTFDELVTEVYKAGADQELEACCEQLRKDGWHTSVHDLRAARRPKPLSLKEQALEQLGCIQTDLNKFGMGISTHTIRRALEQLND